MSSEESTKKVIGNALKGNQSTNFEFITRAKDGREVILPVNTSKRRDIGGKITGVLAVGQDVTGLVGYRNGLEKKVVERTLKLKEALKKEKKLSELKSGFVSTVSHESRMPLSTINFIIGAIKKYGTKMEPSEIQEKQKIRLSI